MVRRTRALASAAALALMAALAGPVSADSLQDAIALAYQTNPTLLAQRAQQRALDETYVQARAGLRPNINASVGAAYTRNYGETTGGAIPDIPVPIDTDGDGIPDATATIPGAAFSSSGAARESNSGSVSVGLSQVLYTGGRLAHGINASEAAVLAGREDLRAVEQSVLQGVIQAYVDVQRDMEILRIRQDNIGVLSRQLEEASARFEVGEITRTDVAQAEARLAQSESDLAGAQAQLSVSRAAYAAVVGQTPTDLETPPPLPGVPNDFDVALDAGLVENPGLTASEYRLRGAEARVAAARSEYLPSASLNASYGGSSALNEFDPFERTSLNVTANLTVPLFTGGLNRSRVAQALEDANVAQIGVEGERREVLRSVSTAYAQMISARSSLQAGEEAVRAARIAAEGVRQEAQVGLRTTLDVLNQELELRSAEVNLVSARRNEYVAQAALLAAMGRLEGPALVPSLDPYDPAANFQRVRNRGGLPWDGVIEAIDRIAAPSIMPANDQVDAPIDTQLKSQIIRTAPTE
ncbi:TolC family outer membrane protein [Brevundimonas sp.]|uniref:TolC family outer membrane protein n=1 Tax=Brevundimonas sp. TaxID=1871086 RepID=UPI00391B7DF3